MDGASPANVFAPFLLIGPAQLQRFISTHMFVVVGFLHLFLLAGKRMWTVPLFFIAVVLFSALLGEIAARFYSEPMNRWLRKRWGDGPENLGSAIRTSSNPVHTGSRIAL